MQEGDRPEILWRFGRFRGLVEQAKSRGRPVSWHDVLHVVTPGLQRRMQSFGDGGLTDANETCWDGFRLCFGKRGVGMDPRMGRCRIPVSSMKGSHIGAQGGLDHPLEAV